MVTLSGQVDDGAGSLEPLLDRSRQPTGRARLELGDGLPVESVMAAAREVLIVDGAEQVDVAVNGRLVGVVTLASLSPVRVVGRGQVRGEGRLRRPGAPVARPALIRLTCRTCGALVCVTGRPATAVDCPAGHPLSEG